MPEILDYCRQILADKNAFILLNLYSMGFSSLITKNLVQTNFNNPDNVEFGELFLEDTFKKNLPLGVFARFVR